MISFLIGLAALIAGYFLYGSIVERVFRPDNRPTPAQERADGVDFMVLPTRKVFMIQFLNIAGTGPIFGAIMGARCGLRLYVGDAIDAQRRCGLPGARGQVFG